MTELLYVTWFRSHGRQGAVSDDQSRRTAEWVRQALPALPHQAYRLIGAGDTTRRLGRQAHHVVPPFHSRLDDPEAPDTLVVTRLETLDAARRCRQELVAAVVDRAPVDLVGAGVYTCLQEWDAGATDPASWAPVVHFGTYDTHHPDDEWQLADYYADVRMPRFVEQEGALRAHRLAGACGAPGRTAVLYELASVEARTRNFEPLEAQAEAGRAQALTLHGALSPSIGVRIDLG
jgi:hypothetical protein